MSTTTLSAAPATGAGAGGDAAGAVAPKKSKKKLIIIAVLVLALGGAGAWFFLLRGGGEKQVKAPEKGAVLVVEPISINLADGHYLKLGFGLQLTKELEEEPDSSQALAIAIDQFSGQSMQKLSVPAERRKAVDRLKVAVVKAYHQEVMDLYPTTMVMQ